MTPRLAALTRWTAWIGRTAVFIIFSLGVVLLLLWLAGRFEPKVSESSPGAAAASSEIHGEVVPVRSMRLPRVESAVIRLVPRRERDDVDPAPLQQLLAIAFGQRRKMLRGTLLPWLAQRGIDAPEIEPTARAEQIGIDVWWALAARLSARAAGGPTAS